MSNLFSRTDRGFFAEWWWTVDRWTVIAMLGLIGVGFLMAFAASPAVAQKIDMPIYHFTNRQFIFLILALGVGLGVSMCSPAVVLRLGMGVFIFSLIGMVAILGMDSGVKGASRWLRIGGFSIQPSEFLKPGFVMLIAWLFAHQNTRFDSKGTLSAFVVWLGVSFLLICQPDIGQMVLLSMVWVCLFFLAGGALWVLLSFGVAGGLLTAFLYMHMPHVASRIDRFFDPASGDTYQVDRAMDAIRAGGLFGVGLGDGRVKSILPDAHSDYVFAVAAEEAGLFGGMLIIGIFTLLIWRIFNRLSAVHTHWAQLVCAGLGCLLGLQAVINLAVNLNLVPSKGMTLPFISYGGSSLLASALSIGIVLSLTRRRMSDGYEFFSSRQAMRRVMRREVAIPSNGDVL